MPGSPRLHSEWFELNEANAKRAGGYMGVYEIRKAGGETVLMGFAGGHSRLGLRGELEREVASHLGSPYEFRVEVNNGYITRYCEILMVFRRDHGVLPAENADDPCSLGRLDPL